MVKATDTDPLRVLRSKCEAWLIHDVKTAEAEKRSLTSKGWEAIGSIATLKAVLREITKLEKQRAKKMREVLSGERGS